MRTYLLLAAKNIQISMAKNVRIMTYETSTKNISFIAGLDSTTNNTAHHKRSTVHSQQKVEGKREVGSE